MMFEDGVHGVSGWADVAQVWMKDPVARGGGEP